ncbi:MAG: GNAT family N-acetyltransferase [Rhodospirillales bacterium]
MKIRPAVYSDLQKIIDLDAEVSGLAKNEYWEDRFNRFTERDGRHLIVAASSVLGDVHESVLGFIVGEIRAWEFGSRPCGWIFAIGVSPDHRVQGIGEQLFGAMCDAFKADGANSVRTMIARQDQLNMSFFRAQGMMGGPFIELEKPLD